MAGAIIALLLMSATCAFAKPFARTHEGNVSGKIMKSRYGREFMAFVGLPYAEPPIGDLRFRDPVPKKRWSGVFEAEKDGNQCVQFSGLGSEDCLMLNVYTPRLLSAALPLLPVMVFVHGGGYVTGNNSDINCGPEFLLDKDIVLVTMNYRLGIFGFLSTGDAAAPGNFGMKDQRLALEWVRRNILVFGGNPDRVTLFGESAGSSSIHLHALSDSSKHLFDRYIMQSGNALCPWAFRAEPAYYEYADEVARKYNCTAENTFDMVTCLRKLTTFQLVDTTSIFKNLKRMLTTAWGPTIEPPSKGAFLTESPMDLMRQGKLKDSPIITGVLKNEGLLFTAQFVVNDKLYEKFKQYPVQVIKELLELYDPVRGRNLTGLAIKIKDFYLGKGPFVDKEKVMNDYSDLLTDYMFFYPQTQALRYMKKVDMNPFYFYSLEYRGTYSITECTTNSNITYGVSHADDLIYLFPIYIPYFGSGPVSLSESDNRMVDQIVDFWSTFAYSGRPTSTHLGNPFLWQPYPWYEGRLRLGYNSQPTSSMQYSFFERRMKFWYENVPPFDLSTTKLY